MVVIKGLAITAGSRPTFFAPKGKSVPTAFATTMAENTVAQMASAMIKLFCGSPEVEVEYI